MSVPGQRNGIAVWLALAIGSGVGGTGVGWYALQGPHRYTQQEANRDLAELRAEIRDVKDLVDIFMISGPAEVRASLARIERRLEALTNHNNKAAPIR